MKACPMPRFQFSLRTLFVVMTVVAVSLAVAVPVTRYVIRTRREARTKAVIEKIDKLLSEHWQ